MMKCILLSRLLNINFFGIKIKNTKVLYTKIYFLILSGQNHKGQLLTSFFAILTSDQMLYEGTKCR